MTSFHQPGPNVCVALQFWPLMDGLQENPLKFLLVLTMTRILEQTHSIFFSFSFCLQTGNNVILLISDPWGEMPSVSTLLLGREIQRIE